MDREQPTIGAVARHHRELYPLDSTAWGEYYWLRERTIYHIHADLNPLRSHVLLEGINRTNGGVA